MDVGHEIIKQQLFFRKELRERVYWFIKLRWAAAGAGLLGLGAAHLLGLGLPIRVLLAVVFFIILYNILFLFIGKRLESIKPTEVYPFEIFAHAQISLDLFSLFLLIFFTGGLASPVLIFVIFHVILAGILLSPLSCYFYALVILAGLAGLIALHHHRLVPETTAWIGEPLFFHSLQYPRVLISYLTFAAGILIAAYLITSVKMALRFKGREVMKISRDLEISNTKLTSLYEMIKEVDAHTSLKDLLDTATRNAARIMGVKACSIKLLDQDNKYLRFASTYGLSEDYLSKDSISVEESAVNRQILEGSLYTIGNVDEENRFQYPEDVRKEGIASMLCLPLKVEDRLLGVFCVYSGEPYFFSEADVEFFSLMTDLTALAIENLSRQTARIWFLNKAAHQLRSPIGAVQSMLKTISGGYLGGLEDQQKEVMDRCEKRLAALQRLINDLLNLADKRHETGPLRLQPVDPARVLNNLTPMYQSQAEAKGLAIEFNISETLPAVAAREELLDDLFTNLISNAVKYTPSGGKIWVGLSAPSRDYVLFEVADTGIGIPENDLSNLFSEFFRTEKAKALEEGTGLGLVIVKEILDRLGGKVQVESKVGQGTKFSCLLPAVRPPDEAKPAANL